MRNFLLISVLVGFGLALSAESAGAAFNSADIPQVASLAAAQALGIAAQQQYPTVQTAGYRTPGLGGAIYTWNSASTVNDCAHVAVSGVATGRYVLRWDLQGNQIFPTQCGAYFDSDANGDTGHDDAAAWNATEVVAEAYGLVIGPVPGITRVLTTISAGAGVIHQGAGQGVEIVQCNGLITGTPACFYIQNANGTNQVEAPKFYDMSIRSNPGVIDIQYNSIAGGFSDGPDTQAYMLHPMVERVTFDSESGTAVQCSKCFDGNFDNNLVSTSFGWAFDMEGSDWITVNNNRVIGMRDIAIALVQHGTFGNGDVVSHNDLLFPTVGIQSYIFSSARSAVIEFNGIEGGGVSGGTCNINISAGFTVTVANNLLQDTNATYGLCFGAQTWYSLDVHGNTLADTNGGAVNFSPQVPFFVPSALAREKIVHYNNNTEIGFPFNTQASPSAPQGGAVLDITPDSFYNISSINYGATVLIESASDALNSGAYILPAMSGFGSEIQFTNTPYPLVGTFNVCFVAQTGTASNTVHIVYLDGGATISDTTVTLGTKASYCPSALKGITPTIGATFYMYNSDTTHGGNDYVYELQVLHG